LSLLALGVGPGDEVVCPSRPEPFYAIGIHYVDFTQVDDAEVVALLAGDRA
jgi:putative phosphoribosyl transferase